MSSTISSTIPSQTEEEANRKDTELLQNGFIRLKTHDTSLVEEHIPNFQKFADDLQSAVDAVWPTRHQSRYSEAHVLLLSWEDDNLGVDRDIKQLEQVFMKIYQFQVQEFKIPRRTPGKATVAQVSTFLENDGQDSLLIVYYAGHGRLSQQTNEPPIWAATDKLDSPTLPSGGIQQLFEEAESDILMLYDSCHSSHPAVGVSGQGVTELIAACGFETQAPAVGPHSFTTALIRALEESFSGSTFSVADLHSRIIGFLKNWKPALLKDKDGNIWLDGNGKPKYECHKRRTPVHFFLTQESPCRSIMLAPLSSNLSGVSVIESDQISSVDSSVQNHSSDERSETTTSTTTSGSPETSTANQPLEVLISVQLEDDFYSGDDNDDKKKLRSWCEWMRNIPSEAKGVKIQAVYDSCSTLVLVTVPIVLWDLLPDCTAYGFIGFVRSDNLASSLLADLEISTVDAVSHSSQSVIENISTVQAAGIAEDAVDWARGSLAAQEDPDTANKRIRELYEVNQNLIRLLAKSNEENERLKKGKKELITDFDYERKSNRRELPLGSSAPPDSRRVALPKMETDTRPQADYGERKTSGEKSPVPLYDRAAPSAPPPPSNPSAPLPSESYSPTIESCTPGTIAYAPAPVLGNSPPLPPSSEPTWKRPISPPEQTTSSLGFSSYTTPETISQASSVETHVYHREYTRDPASVETLTQSLAETTLDPPSQADIRTTDRSTRVEKLDNNYKLHGQHEFNFGKVFKVLWSEPKGMGQGSDATHILYRQGKYGDEYFCSVRRFMIISERRGHCICLPIMSYGNRGTTKPGVRPGDHAIIYTSPYPERVDGENGLTKSPIKVIPNGPQHKLDSSSRLNYAKIYTVEVNVKVCFIGRVHPDWEWHLRAGFNETHPPLYNTLTPPYVASTYAANSVITPASSSSGYEMPGSSGSFSAYSSEHSYQYSPAQFQGPAPSYSAAVSSQHAAQDFQRSSYPSVRTSLYRPEQSTSDPR